MRTFIKRSSLILLCVIIISCESEEVISRKWPGLTTLPVTEITPEGVTFNAEIFDRGDFEMENYGFEWYVTDNKNTKHHSSDLIKTGNVSGDFFSQRVEVTLEKDVSYIVRARMQTKDFVIYGEEVLFKSLGSNGPQLKQFFPQSGSLGDTITIVGEYFGTRDTRAGVYFGDLPAPILKKTSDTIWATVPTELNNETSVLNVAVSGNATAFKDNFTLLKPVIESVTPLEIALGDTLLVNGVHFGEDIDELSVTLESEGRSVIPEFVEVSDDQLKLVLPPDFPLKTARVVIGKNNFKVVSEQTFTIADPVILSFMPVTAVTGGVLTITGNNFSPLSSSNLVRVDGFHAEVISASAKEIKVNIPSQEDHIYSGRQVNVEVEVLSASVQAQSSLQLVDKWFRLADLPLNYSWGAVTINGEVFAFFDVDLYKYEPATGQWTWLTSFPDTFRQDPAVFAVGEKIYVGGGDSQPFNGGSFRSVKDFWEYDPVSGQWGQIADFPGTPRARTLNFSLDNQGYVGAGRDDYGRSYSDIWKYDPISDSWSGVAPYPTEISGIWDVSHAELNGSIYAGYGRVNYTFSVNKVFKYDNLLDSWSQIQNYPAEVDLSIEGGGLFSLGNEIFFGYYKNGEELWSFNGSAWNQRQGHKAARLFGFSFEIDNIAYFGGGNLGEELWIFDDSQSN
ncbi:hypothetical protein E7Z59_07985 [Robertkochia marina]|uniref:IPT/TIG domain-containing protein n=1 Tax=Robertkochia marina TaxID=1227945 RepID=A0A4S3LZT6_9FLAO|nr:IPT/TIG domain-containing protein [Robertkochia marina]THD67591.1 hypothetical protein E7Z59_07985 [Robertkochia marina]TRZ44540.1 hypothetical protein D3A96_07960 [Robertkochia marina]